MTIDSNFTIKVTSTPKVQMKHWGFGQLSLNKQYTLSPQTSPSYTICTGK